VEEIPVSPGKVRFKKLAKKVILKNRKDIALKAIEDASEYLAEKQARSGFYLKSNFEHKRGSMYGLHSEVSC
jgi:hypothetical protein